MKICFIAYILFSLTACTALKNSRIKKEKDYIITFTQGDNPFKKQFKRTSNQRFKPTKSLKSYNLNDNNINYFLSKGYVILGESQFKSTFCSTQYAVNAGCSYGASVLLYRYDYYGTETGRSVGRLSNGDGKTYTLQSTTNSRYNGTGSSNYSAIGSNGYAFGYGNSSVNGTYKSQTTTTITDPGTFSYYVVPYEYDYYKQHAVFLAKKFYWVDNNILMYESNKLTGKQKVLEKGKFFEILNWCKGKTHMKIKTQNSFYYIPCDGFGNANIY